MRNLTILLVFCSIIIIAILIGVKRASLSKPDLKDSSISSSIPHIGRVEVLNGCGEPKAASMIADYLRSKNFDVKDIGNADSWNYPSTIVVSRTRESTIAQKVCKVLNTDKFIFLRTNENNYNVSVIVGADFQELIK
jgi:hypothetical protein